MIQPLSRRKLKRVEDVIQKLKDVRTKLVMMYLMTDKVRKLAWISKLSKIP